MAKQIIEIREILILPPIDIPLFLALYDGQDEMLMEVVEKIEKNFYDEDDAAPVPPVLDSVESTLV